MGIFFDRLRGKFGKGELWALAGALGYSLDNVFTAFTVRGQGVNFLLGASLRSLPVLVFSLLMTVFAKKASKKGISPFTDYKLVLALAAYGVLTFFIGNTMFFSALEKGGVLITTPLAGTQVLWAAIFAIPIIGEKLNFKMVFGMFITIIGILVLAVGKSDGVNLMPRWWLAIPLSLGTAVCWSLSGVLIAYAQRKGVNRFHALLFALVVGNVVLNGYLLVTGQIDVYSNTSPVLVRNLLMAGLFNTFALVGITTALGLTTVASASTLGSLQIALAPLLAWLLIKEDMNWIISIGILFIFSHNSDIYAARL